MLTLTTFTWCSSAMRSRTGETAWHGPHHSAQKSTRILPSASRTSLSKVSLVAFVAIWVPFESKTNRMTNAAAGRIVPCPGTIESMFQPLPDKPDHPALELEILELWEREGTFAQLRERNRGGPKWSFVDGPVTANKPLAVHTAW